MPTFTRYVEDIDHEFTTTIDVAGQDVEISGYVSPGWDEEFTIDVDDFYREMDLEEREEMRELLDVGTTFADAGDFWRDLPNDKKAELVDFLKTSDSGLQGTNYIIPDVVDLWYGAYEADKDWLKNKVISEYNLAPATPEHTARISEYAHKLIDALVALGDDELFGVPDSYLNALRTRLGDIPAQSEQRATTSTNPVLRQILASLEPGATLDKSLLNEMRLLAGSTSNA